MDNRINMKPNMKKSIYILVLLAAVSCKVSDGGSSNHTADALRRYTGALQLSMVDYTVEVFDVLLDIDAYLQASDEEKNDARFKDFRENLKHLDATTFKYVDKDWTIATGGTSLLEQGSAWTLTTTSKYSYIYYSWVLYPGHDGVMNVTCTGEKSWDITEGEDDALSMSISGTPSPDFAGKMDFKLSCRGFVTPDDNGYRAEFSSDDVVTVSVEEDYEGEIYTNYEYDGYFFLQTLRNSEAIDWCRLKYSGFDVSCETNL